jgi:hypothetical protein
MKRYIRSAIVDISDESKELRAEVARTTDDPEILDNLSQDSDDTVRWWVATNNAATLDTLTRLFKDPYTPVGIIALNNVYNNNKAPLSIMDTLPLDFLFEVALSRAAVPTVKDYALKLVKEYGTPDMIVLLRKYGYIHDEDIH